jgi:hypothetical protein
MIKDYIILILFASLIHLIQCLHQKKIFYLLALKDFEEGCSLSSSQLLVTCILLFISIVLACFIINISSHFRKVKVLRSLTYL